MMTSPPCRTMITLSGQLSRSQKSTSTFSFDTYLMGLDSRLAARLKESELRIAASQRELKANLATSLKESELHLTAAVKDLAA
eukprot:scaffold6472_cov258-Ochromonas_danica.AAC.2